MLQAAGPDLTPQNMSRGVHALPVLGAPSYSYGAWSWNLGPTGQNGAGEHSSLIDARFVWWNRTSPRRSTGCRGASWRSTTASGSGLGQWPKTVPPLFGG